jgi:hypothetical protein
MSTVCDREIEREVRRVFRRFVEPEGFAARMSEAARMGLFVSRNRWRKPVAFVEARIWTAFERRDLVRPASPPPGWEHPGTAWRPSEAGLAFWRRLEAPSDSFLAQHRLHGVRVLHVEGRELHADVNEAETPLGWLRRRKGPDGRPLLSEAQFEAGERLRADFTRAGMTPRVTTDWSLALGPGGRGRRFPRDPADIADSALAARERLAHALEAAGPGLSDVLLEVCCHLRGLEEAERGFGWPQRSAKIVLQIALDRLAVHYGIPGAPGR